MRWLASTLVVFLWITVSAPAATLNNVKILEASENIKYLTQNIAKNYLYLYLYPNKQHLKIEIQHAIQNLESNIQTIAITTKAAKTKELLDFFAYEKEQIKLLLKEKPTSVRAMEFLDFSEALTEGADSIVSNIHYTFSFEDKMFMRSKRIEYRVEELAKDYMVLALDMDKAVITQNMRKAVVDVDESISKIEQYTYPKTLHIQKQSITMLWQSSKRYYASVDHLKIPSIVLLTTQGLQKIMAQIAIHHGKGE